MARAQKILIIDDDKDNLRIVSRLLEHQGYETTCVSSGVDALQSINTQKYDLMILDVDMPGLDGFQTLRLLHQREEYVSVIFLTGQSNTDDLIRGLEAGALDYICKPYNPLELVARVKSQLKFKQTQDELRAANKKLQSLVDIDDLTGLYNMRTIYDRINHEIERARRYKHGIAVIMMDMDHFKRVNDNHDHLFGSFVLSEVGKLLKKNIRNTDFAARYGGDEFLICLSQTEPMGALRFTERLRKRIAETEFVSGEDRIKLTCSFGVSILDGSQQVIDAHTLVRVADCKLYEAKENGRDRVEGEIITETNPVDPRFLRKTG